MSQTTECTIVVRNCDSKQFMEWVDDMTTHSNFQGVVDDGNFSVFIADSNGDFELDRFGNSTCPVPFIILEQRSEDGTWTQITDGHDGLKDARTPAIEIIRDILKPGYFKLAERVLQYTF